MKSSVTRHKKNYFHFNFIGGAYFGATNNNILTLAQIFESLNSHFIEIKAICYASGACCNDILRINQQINVEMPIENSDSPIDIDDLNEIKDSDKFEDLNVSHKSNFKIEVSINKIQADLLTEKVPKEDDSLAHSANFEERKSASFGNEFQDIKLNKRSSNQEDTKFALLSFILEKSNFKISMLEEVGSKDGSIKLKFGFKINDILAVNNLFVVSPKLDASYCKNSVKISNHPKLFDQDDIRRQND